MHKVGLGSISSIFISTHEKLFVRNVFVLPLTVLSQSITNESVKTKPLEKVSSVGQEHVGFLANSRPD